MSESEHPRIPSVEAIVGRVDAEEPVARFGERAFARAVRSVLEDVRGRVERHGGPIPRAEEVVADATRRLAEQRSHRLRGLVNATGVVLPANLGRAPLSAGARDALLEAAGYASVDLDPESGGRGGRATHLGELAAEACGTEAALVVNNGAGAMLLVLAALSAGRETVVARGEVLEFGDGYRLPDTVAASGAVLREVGTTNATRLGDYRAAVGDRTGVVLKVHRSAFAVVGDEVSTAAVELAELAGDSGVPFVHVVGTGLLRDQDAGPLEREVSVATAVRDGADLVVFSADKLLGGPQAGVIAGRSDLVLRAARHPLARALRIDKLRRAALEATLESHLRADAPRDLPVWAMLTTPTAALEQRARALADRLGGKVTAEPTRALVGGGTVPGVELASWGIRVPTTDAELLARELFRGRPPVVARTEDGAVLLDLRTVPPAQDQVLGDLVRAATAR